MVVNFFLVTLSNKDINLKSNNMKKAICLLALSLALASCKDQGKTYVQSAPVNNAVVTPVAPSIGDNLNLAALGDLVKNSTTAQEIESRLNSSGSINNLDLDGDENVDYIRVAEYGTGNNRGFSFNVDLPDGTSQKVADVDLINSNNGVQMNVRGNQEYYGSNYHHQAHYDMGDVLLMSYLLNNHRPYYSPYRYGSYPRNYASYRPVPQTTYTKRVTTTTTTTSGTARSSTPSGSKPSSTTSTYITPKYTTKSTGTTAKPAVAPRVNVSAPTTSQKSFTPTSTAASKPTTTGFKTSGTSTYKPTTTTSSYKPTSYKPSSTSYKPTTTSKPSTGGFSSGSSSYKSSSSSYKPSYSSSSSSSSKSSSSFGSSSKSSYSSYGRKK